MNGRLHQAVDSIGRLPGVRHWRKSTFDRRFEAGQAIGTCRGVFESYAEAAAAAPRTLPLGYNTVTGAQMYRDRVDTIYPSDYPMMFWLQSAFASGARSVFDLGGHIGLSFYSYRKAITFPDGFTWKVNDLPEIVKVGREEAKERDPSGKLAFADKFEEVEGSDILFTAGCLQYLDDTLAQRIATLKTRPTWLLVNLLPFHEAREFWTVQSIGSAFCPYRIQRPQVFFSDLERLGYRLVDKWENLEKSCWVAFDPAHSLDRYYGAVLTLVPQ